MLHVWAKSYYLLVLLCAIVSTPVEAKLNNKQGIKLMLQSGHTSFISDITFSHSGKYMLSASYDSSIRLWETQSGKLIRIFGNHKKTVHSIAFSADDKNIISVSGDHTCNIFEVHTGKIVFSKQFDKEMFAVDYSPDGSRFAISGIDPNIFIYNAKSKILEKVLSGHTSKVSDLSFSHDGKSIASAGNDGNVIVWNVATGKETSRHFETTLGIASVAFSSDDERIVFCSAYSKKMGVWKWATGTIDYNLPAEAYHHDTTFSPDGKWIALTSAKDVIVVNAINGAVKVSATFNKKAFAVAFSPDSKQLAVGIYDGAIKFVSVENGEVLKSFRGRFHKNPVLTISPDGRKIISGTVNNELILWDFLNPKFYKVYQGHSQLAPIAVTPDSQFIVTANKQEKIYLRNIKTGKISVTYDFDGGYINDIAIFPNGTQIVVACEYGLYLFDLFSGKKIKNFTGHIGGVNTVAIVSGGSRIISGGDDRMVRRWNKETSEQEKIYLGAQQQVTKLELAMNGKYYIGAGRGNSIYVWDAATGILKTSHKDSKFPSDMQISNLAVSPKGDSILYSHGSYYFENGNIQSWDIESQKVMKRFSGDFSHVFSSVFTKSGKFALSSSKDGAIRIWNPEQGVLLATLIPYGTKDWVILTADGRFDGTPGGMKNLYYVDGMEVIPLDSLFERYYTPNLLKRLIAGEKIKRPDVYMRDLKLPPLVEIVTPHSNHKHKKKQLSVTVRVTDQGGGIDEIRLFQNGKLVHATQRGVNFIAKGKKSRTFTLTLANGENRIKLTAFSKQRTESMPKEISVFYDGEKKLANIHLLIVGINKYKNSQYNLNYALSDANAFKDEIEKNSGGIFRHVETHFLSDENATKKNIARKFAELKKNIGQEDVFVFYYAGHGVMSMEKKSQFYIAPYDVVQLYGDSKNLKKKGISVKELESFAVELRAQKQLYIFDACQSGGITEHLATRGNAEEKAIALLARTTGTYWLTASGSEQYATEFAELGHGIFTYAILLGLRGEADKGSKDRQITVQELDVFIKDKVPDLSEQYKSEAQFPKSYGGGDDFPLIIVE